MTYTLTGKKCINTIDNDHKKSEEIKEQILRMEREFKKSISEKTTLPDDNFHMYPEYVYSLEYFLLNAKAISKAGEKSEDKEIIISIDKEIQDKLNKNKNKQLKPKDFLSNIWDKYHFEPYHEVDTATKIAKCIEKEDIEKQEYIMNLLKEIVDNN